MVTGYLTNAAGHVLSYFDLSEKPENTENNIWIEADSLPSLYTSPPNLNDVLAAHRYAILNGGFTYDGVPYQTDAESRSDLLAAFVAANAIPTFTTSWKGSDGKFYSRTNAQIIAAGKAVLGFVAKCFAVEDTIKTNIANYTTEASVIAAFDAGMASG